MNFFRFFSTNSRQQGSMKRTLLAVLTALILIILSACGGNANNTTESGSAGDEQSTSEQTQTAKEEVLRIGAIPDQEVAKMSRLYGAVADYLTEATGIKTEYVPTNDYAALVTAFERGDIHLAWFGGLTAVQAHAVVPGAESFAQRPRDAEFHSLFIVQSDLDVETLEDLRGLTFTFGSESSTSGHLMPRYFLLDAGIDPEKDFQGPPNFSGSHDRTYKLVESGAFQAGALNEAVWEAAVESGNVDTSKVRVFYKTPPYFDYNWTLNDHIDEKFGEGAADKIKQAILNMGPEQQEILDLFATDKFIETKNENYDAIREVAKSIGVIR